MMARSTHYLRPSKHAGFPRLQAAVVVEYARLQRDDRPTLANDILMYWSGVIWSGTPGEEATVSEADGVAPESFWRWVRSHIGYRRQLWIWMNKACHSLGLLGFWERITNGEWKLTKDDLSASDEDDEGRSGKNSGLCVIQDPPTIILAFPGIGSGSVRFLDIQNLGLSQKDSMVLCANGPEAVAAWLQEWAGTVDELHLGGLRCTAPAQAWHGWRYHYLQVGVLIHGDEDTAAFERDSIAPGRCECFRIGDIQGSSYAFDGTAFYPACSVSTEMPCRFNRACSGGLAELERSIDRGWLAIARVRLSCREPTFPCRKDGLTIWPVGTWTATLAGPELVMAIANGNVVRLLQTQLYEPDRPFEGFMSRLWTARAQAKACGKDGSERAVKLLMNSLVGKLAAKQKCWVDCVDALPPGPWWNWVSIDAKTHNATQYRSIGWHCQRLESGGETAESCPAIASWIYSVGRMKLLDWIETAGWENTYYVDSDGIICSDAGRVLLSNRSDFNSGGMGSLRLHRVLQSLRIGGIKSYASEQHSVMAGIPGGSADDAAGGHTFWREETIPESIGFRQQPASMARLVTVPVFHQYRHGRVAGDGKVTPIEVDL